MEKKQAIELLMLLSALESWALSLSKPLPDYLHDNLVNSMSNLMTVFLVDGSSDTKELQ